MSTRQTESVRKTTADEAQRHGEIISPKVAKNSTASNRAPKYFSKLLKAITRINDETYDRFGDDVDGRDYEAIRRLIESSLTENVFSPDGIRRDRYLNEMAKMLSNFADS